MKRYIITYASLLLFLTLMAWFLMERKKPENSHHHITQQEDSRQLILPKLTDYEICLDLTKPQKLSYGFQSETPVTFDLHYHVGEEVHYPVKQKTTSSWNDIFEPAEKHHYCLYWQNLEREDVQIKYHFKLNSEE